MLLHRPTALLPLPLPRKWCCRFISPLKINRPRPSLNPRILGPMASMLTTKPSKATRLTTLESLLSLDSKSKTFLWLWWLVAGLSPRKLGFALGTETGLSPSCSALPCQYHFTLAICTRAWSSGWTVGPLLATVQRRSLIPVVQRLFQNNV
jgi:hypothetical protein